MLSAINAYTPTVTEKPIITRPHESPSSRALLLIGAFFHGLAPEANMNTARRDRWSSSITGCDDVFACVNCGGGRHRRLYSCQAVADHPDSIMSFKLDPPNTWGVACSGPAQ